MAHNTFTDATFQKDVLQSALPVLVDIWAEWCSPCRIIGPIVEELAKEYTGKMTIGKLNIDENPTTGNAYHVLSIPTLLFFKGGKVVDQVVGVQSKDQLKKKIETVLAS